MDIELVKTIYRKIRPFYYFVQYRGIWWLFYGYLLLFALQLPIVLLTYAYYPGVHVIVREYSYGYAKVSLKDTMYLLIEAAVYILGIFLSRYLFDFSKEEFEFPRYIYFIRDYLLTEKLFSAIAFAVLLFLFVKK